MTATPSVLARTVRGAGWVIAGRMGMRVLGLISTLILVRLLAPSDFGLLALASGLTQAVDCMMVLGTEEAVIRQNAPDRSVYDTAFTLNVIRGLIVTAIVLACAAPAADFFNDERLTGVMLIVALPPLLDGLSNIGTVDFRREMQFQKEAAIVVVPKFFGILATIAAALIHPTYIALLFGVATNQSLRCVMSYVMHPFRPRLSLRAWRGLIGYSLWTWWLSVAILFRERSDTFILGRLTNPSSVGLYSVGAEIAALPTSELVDPLCRASFAGFAAANREGASAVATWLRLLATAATIVLPAGVGLALVAHPLVRLAFGPAWDASVPVIQVLGIAGAMTVFGNISLHLLSAHGLLGRLTGIVFAGVMVRIVLLLILIPPLGVTGAGIAAAVAIVMEQSAMMIAAAWRFRVGPGALARGLWRPIAATAAMAGGLLLTGLGAPVGDGGAAAPLALAVALGAVSYAAVLVPLWALSGRPAGPEADILAWAGRAVRR